MFTINIVAVVEITAFVLIFMFISLVLRAETLGNIGMTLAEAFKERFKK